MPETDGSVGSMRGGFAPGRFLLPAVAFILPCLLFTVHLGDLPLIQPDEGRNAEVAREMHDSGAWMIPTHNGVAYLDKPAFYFRAVALALTLFGVNEAAARAPSVLFALVLLLALYGFCRRFYGERCAALAVMVVASSPLVIVFARMVIMDMALALFTSTAILSSFMAWGAGPAERRRWLLLSAVLVGAASLTKGPVGFIVPGLVVLLFFLDRRRPREFLARIRPGYILVFLAVALPYFVIVSVRRPDFPHYGLMEETFRRYATPDFHRTGAFYYYAPVLMAVFFPWSALLPEATVRALRKPALLAVPDRLFAVWAVGVVLFFSTSRSKLPGYILTAVLALGVLVARLFDSALDDPRGKASRIVLRGLLVLSLSSLAVFCILGLEILHPGSLQRGFHIRSAEMERLAPALAPVAGLLILVAVLALIAWFSRNVKIAFATFLLFPVGLLTVGFTGVERYAEAASARPLLRSLPVLPEGTEIACLQCFPLGLPFYLREPLTVITEDGRELTSRYAVYMLRRTADWPPTLVPLPAWRQWLEGRDHPVFLLARRRGRDRLEDAVRPGGGSVQELVPGWWGGLILPGSDGGP